MKQVVTTTVTLEEWEEVYLTRYFSFTYQDIMKIREGDPGLYNSALVKLEDTPAAFFKAGWEARNELIAAEE